MKRTLLFLTLIIISSAFIAMKVKDKNPNTKGVNNPPVTMTVDSKQLDANTISTWFRNNGSFNRNPVTGNSGFEWPKGSNMFARYASGLWLGAVVLNTQTNTYDTLIAMAEYDYEYLPGYTDNSGNPQGKDDPLYRVYKIKKGVEDADRQSWPNILLGNSDQGAPVYEDPPGSGIWKPLDFGSQTLFYVYTDSYPESHGNNGGSTAPLKADIKQINFSYNFGGPLGQIAITQLIIINRSTQAWNNAFLSVWTDDDLGDATDDLVGVDTNLGLGYTYNGDNDDPVYGANPPAVGYDFFRGALLNTNNNNDTAVICIGKERVRLIGYKLLGLNVFNWYYNGQDPANFRETYRYMSGFGKYGDPIINPTTGDTTKFMYSGDPVTNTGWVQTGPNDQRFLQSTGPFTMNPGDTQIIVVGQVIARGNSNLNSIHVLRNYDDFAQLIYDSCFNVPEAPPSPPISVYAPGDGKIYFSWTDAAETTVVENFFSGGTYKFQGYNIYQIKAGTNGSSSTDRKLLATYDIKDGIKDIYDSVFIDEYQGWVYGKVQSGTDNGIARFFILDRDQILGQNLINGTPYLIAVTAYAYDSTAGPSTGTAKVNESPIPSSFVQVIPQKLVQGTQVNYGYGDSIGTNKRDLGVIPIVVGPIQLQSASYRSNFGTNNNQLVWNLTKTVGQNTTTLFTNKLDFSGSQDTAEVVDGFLLVHQRILDSGVVKDVNDPAGISGNIYTRLGGWSYSGTRWIQGPDTTAVKTAKLFPRQFQSRAVGFSFPTIASFRLAATRVKANSMQFTSSGGVLNGGPLRKIRIIFGQTQTAYRYSTGTNVLLTDTSLVNTPWRDMVNIPFSVFAVDEMDSSGGVPRQLNVAFIDADDNGQWDPDTSKLGKYQITYIFASDYSQSQNSAYTSRNLGFSSQFQQVDIMYAWVPRVIKGPNGVPLTYTNGDYLEIYPYIPTRADFVPGYPVSYSWTINGTITGDNSLASSRNEIDKVKVFPNPYYGTSRLETDPFNRFVYFSNLPAVCTIYIYSLNGVLVSKIERNSLDPNNSLEQWNLRNRDDIPVASGMYIALVDAPGIGYKVLKLAIFTPEERLDTY